MRRVTLAVFVVALALMTGCAGMTCPMSKKGQANLNVGRYQFITQTYADHSSALFKGDTTTGELWKFGSGQWDKVAQ